MREFGNRPLTNGMHLPTNRAGILRGILLMCAAAMCFSVMNALAKYLSTKAGFSSQEVIWARNLGHLLFVIALFAPKRGIVGLLRSQRLGIQVIRSLLLLTSTVCFFVSLKFIPLALASSISFTAPFIVTALAAPMLGEKVGIQRWSAVVAGFIGALIVIRPGAENFHWASFLVIGSATCYAFYQILTRRVVGHDSPETTVTYSALVGTLLMSAAVPFDWRTPDEPGHIAMFLALGLLGGSGHYFIARALVQAPASIVSPFNYVQLIGATALGFLIFGDFPDLWMWIGAAIIVASGVFIVWRETRRSAPLTVQAAPGLG